MENKQYFVHNSTGCWQVDKTGKLLRLPDGSPRGVYPWRGTRVNYVGFGLENLPPNPSPEMLEALVYHKPRTGINPGWTQLPEITDYSEVQKC